MMREIIVTSGRLLRQVSVVSALILIMGCALNICAQETAEPLVEVKAIVGGADFVAGDDQSIGHSMVGAALRIYVSKHFGIEPEYLYMRHGSSDYDQAFNLNVAYDFRDHNTRKFVPYLIGGGGFTNTRNRFGGSDFSNGTWTANFGGGLKVFLTKRLFVAPEVRLGHEPAFRASVNIGYVISVKK